MAEAEWGGGPEILDLVHDSIIVRELDGTVVQWNAAAEAQYGWSRADARGRKLCDLLPCDPDGLLARIEAELLAAGTWEGELTRSDRSGRRLRIDVRWSVRHGSDGRPHQIVETGRDVTDQRANEAAIRLGEYRFRNLFEAMAVAFWEIDFNPVGALLAPLRDAGVADLRAYLQERPEFVRELMDAARVLDVNAKTLELFGATAKEEIVGQGTSRFWPDESVPLYVESIAATLERKPHLITETVLLDLRGRPIDVIFTVAWSPEIRQQGVVLLGVIDVGDRKRAFEALAQSELKYRNLFHHMPIALCQLDVRELVDVLGRLHREGVADLEAYMDAHPDFLGQMLQIMRVEQVNQHMVKMLGGSDPSEFVGPIARFWRGTESTVRRSLAARFRGAEAYGEETRVRALDDSPIDVFYTSAFPPALSEMGVGLVGIIDIRQRLEAERMLQQVQADFAHAARVATLGELTASIAHEVNQPLAAIATNGEASLRWLDRAEPNVGEARNLAASMVSDARRAAEVIKHIRAMATRQSDGRELVSVNELVEETLGFLQRDLQAKGIAVDFTPQQDLPRVEADRTQLQQVLVNLAVNAEQAMVQHEVADRRLAVRTGSAPGGCVLVEIEDSGPGVPDELAQRLFDSFVTTKPDGLGIGLSICRSIIEAHGGRISVANRDKGARFTFTLPAATPELEIAPAPVPA